MMEVLYLPVQTVAGELTSEANSAHMCPLSWESPRDNTTVGYVIYYQSERESVISDRVSGGQTHWMVFRVESHTIISILLRFYSFQVSYSPLLPITIFSHLSH